MKPSLLQQCRRLAVFVIICFAAAGLGGLVTASNIPDWYAGIAKPTWNPPNWIFGPVWSFVPDDGRCGLARLAAGWLAGAKLPLTLFTIQLAL